MSFLTNIFAHKPTPIPAKYPDIDSISHWMDQKANYFAENRMQDMYMLFCPSMSDYLPLGVTTGVNQKSFFEHLSFYKSLKEKYPQAAQEARQHIDKNNMFYGGPCEDYI